MKQENKDLLRKGLSGLGISYEEKSIKKLEEYSDIYFAFNKTVNISSIREEKDFVIRHVLDCVAIIPLIDNGTLFKRARLVDLGSGAGFPGLALKIFRPLLDIDLAEVSKKKLSFLRQVIKELSLDVDIVDSSSSKIKKAYDVVLCRAFGSLTKIVKESSLYLKKKGVIVSYKSKKAKQEIEELSSRYKKDLSLIKLRVPFLEEEERNIVVVNYRV